MSWKQNFSRCLCKCVCPSHVSLCTGEAPTILLEHSTEGRHTIKVDLGKLLVDLHNLAQQHTSKAVTGCQRHVQAQAGSTEALVVLLKGGGDTAVRSKNNITTKKKSQHAPQHTQHTHTRARHANTTRIRTHLVITLALGNVHRHNLLGKQTILRSLGTALVRLHARTYTHHTVQKAAMKEGCGKEGGGVVRHMAARVGVPAMQRQHKRNSGATPQSQKRRTPHG